MKEQVPAAPQPAAGEEPAKTIVERLEELVVSEDSVGLEPYTFRVCKEEAAGANPDAPLVGTLVALRQAASSHALKLHNQPSPQ